MGGKRKYGTVGSGPYKTNVDGKITKLYSLWSGVLRRCYDEKVHARHPLYAICTVSELFWNFQEFATWCEKQTGYGVPGWNLDKDLLVRGNTIYHEDRCVFLPKDVNNLISFNKGQVSGRLLPFGVYDNPKDRPGKRYKATVSVNNKSEYIGDYETVDQAFAAYKMRKESIIRTKAEQYKDVLDVRAYNRLSTFEITLQ